MQTTLKKLLDHNNFESYKVITNNVNLEKPIKGVSILETPDFENYIISDTLILTTFYIIKNDIKLFKHLLGTLKQHNSPGIVIKLYRFIDVIPDEIIKEAEVSNIPIVVLDYDANLSFLYKSIYSEIQSDDFLEHNFHAIFSNMLSEIEINPSTSVFIEAAKKEKVGLAFYNYETEKLNVTDDNLKNLFYQFKDFPNDYIRLDDYILRKEKLEVRGKTAYLYMIYIHNKKRYLLDTYSEIYNILTIFISQKKNERILQQDRFLTNFMSNLTSAKTDNDSIVSEGKLYNWNIVFPLFLLLISVDDDTKNSRFLKLPTKIKDCIIHKLGINENEVKYVYLDNKILFISNTNSKDVNACVNDIQEALDSENYKDLKYVIGYTSYIYNAEELPSKYRNLIEASNYLSAYHSNMQVITPPFLELIRITKEFNSDELNSLLREVIKPLVDYENEHNIPLCETLLMYFQQHFNLRETADKLYIHYNTLKYRLKIIEEKLGYEILSQGHDYMTMMFALYMHTMNVI